MIIDGKESSSSGIDRLKEFKFDDYKNAPMIINNSECDIFIADRMKELTIYYMRKNLLVFFQAG